MEVIIYIILSLWDFLLIGSGVYFVTQKDYSIFIFLLVWLLWIDPMTQIKRYKKIQNKYDYSEKTIDE